MSENYEIKHYQYYVFSSRTDDPGKAIIMLYSEQGYLGAAWFGDSGEPLKPAAKDDKGAIWLYYNVDELPVIVDMLRNEKPLYLTYNGEYNSRISTTLEPVGEGELP